MILPALLKVENSPYAMSSIEDTLNHGNYSEIKPLKLITVYSDNYKELFENFIKSLSPDENGIQLFAESSHITNSFQEFGFQSDSWYSMIIRQVNYALRIIQQYIEDGEYFIFCDSDIHFFKPHELHSLVAGFRDQDIQFAALHDRPDYYNTGFIIAKKCPEILELYRRTLEGLHQERLELADQDEINHILHTLDIRHGVISSRIGVLGQQPIEQETIFYHATLALTLEAKLARIHEAKAMMESRRFGIWQDF